MLGNIVEINENKVVVKLNNNVIEYNNLINTYVVFEDNRKIIGEIINVINNNLIIELKGEIINNEFIFGISRKPSFKSQVNLLNNELVPFILSHEDIENKSLFLGHSSIYDNIKINIDINKFFSSHFAIIGGTGSGKSFSVARIIQNIFSKKSYIPYKASLFVFDTYGEYNPSFKAIEENNPYISYKCYTTNLESNENILKIPTFLLGIDDLAILLNATTPSQLQIIEKALSLVNIFKSTEQEVDKIKNDIIARSILDILLSGRPAVQIRDQIFSILAYYKTNDLSLETIIYQPGYNRALKHCLLIDSDGHLREMELLTDFFSKFLLETNQHEETKRNVVYNLKDLENAIDFALISEGIFKSEKVFDYPATNYTIIR